MQEACSKIFHEHEDFLRALSKSVSPLDGASLSSVWTPPPIGFVKLNTYGSYREWNDTMGWCGLSGAPTTLGFAVLNRLGKKTLCLSQKLMPCEKTSRFLRAVVI